jgi:hypothetical protein
MLLVGLGLLGPAGCGGPSGGAVPEIAPDAPKKAIELYDADKNGYLDARELEKAPGLRAAFARSSKVTEQDIAERITRWKDAKAGRQTFLVKLTHNRKPLVGATVTLVPESFLGSAIQTATGKTDEMGRTLPTTPAFEAEHNPGVAPGFYRIEITKDGENIPAKYNTATTLGGVVPQGDESKWDFILEY